MIRVIDEFAPQGLVNAARATWPAPSWEHWHRYTGEHGDKLATKDSSRLTHPCRLLVDRMSCLEVPADCWPDFDLHGAGMHWIREGGRLPLHRDAQTHPLRGWARRINAILYLDDCDGGALTFRDEAGGITEAVSPAVNRLVICTADQLHEVGIVERGERRTLSLFWWSGAVEPQNTSADWITADAIRNTGFRSGNDCMYASPALHQRDALVS